jgi:AAA15 family ATPase/GTPase
MASAAFHLEDSATGVSSDGKVRTIKGGHMSLISISISNFRSIEYVELDCQSRPDKSSSFGLIGLNEAGKSSILKAIALINSGSSVVRKDFNDVNEDIDISFTYKLTATESAAVFAFVSERYDQFKKEEFFHDSARFVCTFVPVTFEKKFYISFKYTEKTAEDHEERWYPVDAFPSGILHNAIFWSAADNYLISHPIELTSFAENPVNTSIPLRNCFLMAGISDIKKRIAGLLDDSTEIEHLQTELGRSVTKHIRTVWPNHPIEISFLITNNKIYFHVRDKGGAGKAKTADQRSDGFRQFVSFLLTISAENQNEELKRTILLLDEPETHLHPMAQEYLLNELIKITSNSRNNVAFFATHSNYMIDKLDLGRNFRVVKNEDLSQVDRMNDASATYASVSYEVFSIASSDYHNELYGKLHEAYQYIAPDELDRERVKNFDGAFFNVKMGLKKNKPWRGNGNQITLPTYIRNCIHHPDNGDKYSQAELRQSIELMKKNI